MTSEEEKQIALDAFVEDAEASSHKNGANVTWEEVRSRFNDEDYQLILRAFGAAIDAVDAHRGA